MLFYAKYLNEYQDKQGNVWFTFVTDLGERVSVKKTYCTDKPASEGQRCILKVRAVYYGEKCFLAYDCVSVLS